MDSLRLHQSSKKLFSRDRQFGFTLIEVLIVTAIVALLTLMAITTLPRQMEKVRDGERKSDLSKIKVAFENFYNDNDCYPSATVLQNCGGTSPAVHELSPYLQKIPCDPKNESYYLYAPEPGGTGATCGGFRIWAKLEKKDDPIIEELRCDGPDGCGAYDYDQANSSCFGGLSNLVEYNYGVSEGVPVLYP